MSHQASLWSMSSLQRVIKIAAAFVTSIGCLVLIGWIVDISIFKSVLPGWVSMKANTAVGFILAGTSLFFSAEPTASKWRLVGWVCSLIVAAIGLATLSEYLWGWELGINQWLLSDDSQPVGTSNPGRMSPLGAFCFTLVGSALWLSGGTTQRAIAVRTRWGREGRGQEVEGARGEYEQGFDPTQFSATTIFDGVGDSQPCSLPTVRRQTTIEHKNKPSALRHLPSVSLVEVLALLTSLIAAQVLVAYLYQVQPIIGFIPYTQMAVHTAVCFLVLGIGILLVHPDRGLIGIITADSAGGAIARRLLPAAIAIPLFLGWLRIVTARIGLLEPAFGTSVLAVLHIISFVGLISWNAQQLHRIDGQRQLAVKALHQANDELEATIRDRTAQLKEANDRLRQSEERLSLAIEGAGMATWDVDMQTGKATWSAQHFRLMGYEPVPGGEATMEMWRNRVHPEDLERVMQAIERAKHERSLFSPEYRIIQANNRQVIWLRVFGRFLYDEAGQAVRFVGILFDNTEKKQAQQERDRFFMLSLDMLCIAGVDGYFKQLNPAWERILGYTQAELIAQPFLNFVHPEDRLRTSVEAENHAAGTPATLFENRYRCKDGSYKWLSWTSVASPESGLLYAVARDVTAPKQAQQQLEQQAAMLQRQADLLELAYEAIIVRDADGTITYWNRGAESVYGWSREEAMGQVTHTLLQTQLPEPGSNLDVIVLQQEHWQGELTHTCKDGKQIIVESRQVLIRNQQGTPTGFLEVNHDITERKRTETTLRNLNQKLQRLLAQSQTLLEVIPIGIGIAEDPECQKIRVNPAFAKQLGIPSSDNASLSASDGEKPSSFKVYLDGRELAPEELPMQYAAAHGVEVLDLEVDVVRDDGKVVTLLEYAAPLFDEAGKTRGSVAAFLDISDRKRAQAQVIQLNATLEQRVEERTAQLQEANQELEAFSYTIAHDLRAPLRGIQGFAQALVEDYGELLDETAQDYIQHIFDGTDRMNDLVQDLLAYSRLSRKEVKLTTVRLTQVVAQAQAQLQSDLQERQANINISQHLPNVKGHHPILVQMVVNLLSNAIKFVAPGVQPQIWVWAEEHGNWVRLWVEDNGIGIAPHYQEQIFGVFERLHGREAYPGTGIGLAIVRKGAERLGGRAGVESAIGQGSQFWIELQEVKS